MFWLIDFCLHRIEFGKNTTIVLLFDENIRNSKINDVDPYGVVNIKYSFSKDTLETDMIPTKWNHLHFTIERYPMNIITRNADEIQITNEKK